jgi:hypothetical protein
MTVIIKQFEQESDVWEAIDQVASHFGEPVDSRPSHTELLTTDLIAHGGIPPQSIYEAVEEFHSKYPLAEFASLTISSLRYVKRPQWQCTIVDAFDYRQNESHGFVAKQFLVIDIADETEAVQVKLSIF